MTKDPTTQQPTPSTPVPPKDSGDEFSLVELLVRAKEGSIAAYHRLRQQYRPLIDASVARYITADMTLQEQEDMREEAERVFLCAISSYDTEQDAVDFGLYAKICLRNGLVSEIRRLNVRHRLGIVPLDAVVLPTDEDPSHAVAEAERFHRLYGMIHEHLSAFENDVWWRYVSGVSVRRIALDVNKDERAVHNAIYRIRKKLRLVLSEEL